jgi:transcriptional regulator with XRE-family HTH domain
MDRAFLLRTARRARGLTQIQLAQISGTSQATLSAYERGLKSPSLKVAGRILAVMDHELTLRARIDWVEHDVPDLPRFWAPNMLWAVEPPTCFATLELPDQIRHTGMRRWSMRDRGGRRDAYEQLVRFGLPQQMIRWIDGGLLIDLWEELDLPDPVRGSWEPAIRLATKPMAVDTLRFFIRDKDPETAPTARVRGYDVVPPPSPPTPPKRRKQRRTRFDPRPPEPG